VQHPSWPLLQSEQNIAEKGTCKTKTSENNARIIKRSKQNWISESQKSKNLATTEEATEIDHDQRKKKSISMLMESKEERDYEEEG
jgi:hypothetical protein